MIETARYYAEWRNAQTVTIYIVKWILQRVKYVMNDLTK